MTYILLYRGPATTDETSHEGWPEWFARCGEQLVDIGSPMLRGCTAYPDGSMSRGAGNLNGYSLVRCDDLDALRALLHDHPFLRAGAEHSIEIFEVPRKDG